MKEQEIAKDYPNEIWKDIELTNGLFQISNYMRVKEKRTGRLRGYYINDCGYVYVHLPINGVDHKVRRCRLMASAFVPNPDNKPQVNHKNGYRFDDSTSNLEWVTASENVKDSWRRTARHNPIDYLIRAFKAKCQLHTPEAIAKSVRTRKRKRLERYYAGWLELEFKDY